MIKLVGKKVGEDCVKTRVVATIGPSSSDKETLKKMAKAGMAVARVNFSHGAHEMHAEVIKRIRDVSKETGIPVAILQDLCGPKIRLGNLPEPVKLVKDSIIKLAIGQHPEAELFTDFEPLPDLVKKDDTILMNDGYVELLALEVTKEIITCKVIVPGTVSARKGINLPDSDTAIEVFTPKDRKDLEFGLQQNVDMVAMSFVDSAKNLIPVKKLMEEYSRVVPVIAKIERPVALTNIEEIMDAFDGIMIARGDLGVEVPPEEVPIIQKKLTKYSNARNKLVITATQMLESMINNPRPTRAEASDVSNAILDGSDLVMLSGETAVGEYPVRSIQMMKRIARTTEGSLLYTYAKDIEKKEVDYTEAIARSAAKIAKDLNAKYILVFSFTGFTALRISKYRPHCPVFAFSSQPDVVTLMSSYWGVWPHLIPPTKQTDDMIREGENILKEKNLVNKGDLIITVSGNAPMKGATNMLKISQFDIG